jgi:hypothetical protein
MNWPLIIPAVAEKESQMAWKNRKRGSFPLDLYIFPDA